MGSLLAYARRRGQKAHGHRRPLKSRAVRLLTFGCRRTAPGAAPRLGYCRSCVLACNAVPLLPERFRAYRYVLLALPLFVLPLLNLGRAIDEVEGWATVPGKVVDTYCYPGRHALRLCRSFIGYDGVDGKTLRFLDKGASSWQEAHGKPVPVLRAPESPGLAVRGGFSGHWGAPSVLLLLGWSFFWAIVLGTLFAVRAQKRRLRRLAKRRTDRNAKAREARRLAREALRARTPAAMVPGSESVHPGLAPER